MIKKWDTLQETKIGNFKIFDLAWIKRKHPDWNKESDFVVLKSRQWVNIIPVTETGNIIMIEQYRHGINEITLEVPGGLVETGENPVNAGERECKEETGFASNENAILLGENFPNPAFLDNKCFSYVWFNCKKVTEQNLDNHEDIKVLELPIQDIKQMILNGKIQHSLVLTAFFFYFLRYSEL